jgi:SAP domain-containing new25
MHRSPGKKSKTCQRFGKKMIIKVEKETAIVLNKEHLSHGSCDALTSARGPFVERSCFEPPLSPPLSTIMAPVYSGSLQPKKKAELQDIASALNLSELGTKEELQSRIKKHLDNNQAMLEDDPSFVGLFGRRKRSVQPHFPATCV